MELAGENESILTSHQKLEQESPSTLLSVEMQCTTLLLISMNSRDLTCTIPLVYGTI